MEKADLEELAKEALLQYAKLLADRIARRLRQLVAVDPLGDHDTPSAVRQVDLRHIDAFRAIAYHLFELYLIVCLVDKV